MTREEVMAMQPGMELNKLVALKIMGFTEEEVQDAMECWEDGVQCHREIEYYSTDIAAAWEVVEKMRETNKRLFTNRMYEIMNPDRKAFQIAPLELIWYMNPLNICKAALLTLIEEE